jgi:hypothetical protein
LGPRESSASSRHLTSPLTVLRELARCRLAWRSPPTRSHGGSQGFKSPHLHPTTALATGLAGHLRRAGAVPGASTGQQTGSNRERNGQPLLDCATRRSEADTYPAFRLRDGCSASIWTAPDGSRLLTLDALSVQTAPDGYRRIVWWMIKRAIKSHPTKNRRQVKRLRLITLIAARGPRHEFCVEVPTSQPNA